MEITLSAFSMALPCAAITLSSGSSLERLPFTRFEKPLNTDSTHTMAIAVTATAHTDIAEMTFTAVCDFFDVR